MERIALFKQYLSEKHDTTIFHEQYLNTIREYAPGTDLYMREMHFLIAADPEQAVSVSQLAQSLNVTLGAASQMASKLEKKGLITRSPDPEDKRRTLVSLTPAGKKLYHEHLEYDKASLVQLSQLFQDFTEDEMKKLIQAEQLFRQALQTKVHI